MAERKPRVRIVSHGLMGQHAEVWIDGVQRTDVTEAVIHLSATRLNTVTLTFVDVDVDVEAELTA